MGCPWPPAGDGYMLAAGHDEDKDKARIGTPMERLMMMVSCSLLRRRWWRLCDVD